MLLPPSVFVCAHAPSCCTSCCIGTLVRILLCRHIGWKDAVSAHSLGGRQPATTTNSTTSTPQRHVGSQLGAHGRSITNWQATPTLS
jgi:hypothetical protein